MEQGTSEWLNWRRAGIGASESAALLGHCPYKTAYQLFTEKKQGVNLASESASGLFRKGHETEALVRAEYELTTGLEFSPALFEHSEYPFIRASLDGWNDPSKRGIEIKMMGKDKLNLPPPIHHLIQMQHQMLVTATDSWVYLRHAEGLTVTQTIPCDLTMQRNILSACWQFWDDFQRDIPPAFGPRDWVPSTCPNLDVALRFMMEATNTKDRQARRVEVLRLAKNPRTVNIVEGPAKGATVTTTPPRVTLPKGE